MKWEYLTAYLGSLANTPGNLEAKGDEGWELVTVTRDGYGVFKRSMGVATTVESMQEMIQAELIKIGKWPTSGEMAASSQAVPQVPGWYWWREIILDIPSCLYGKWEIVHVWRKSGKLAMWQVCTRDSKYVTDTGGEWGPRVEEPC